MATLSSILPPVNLSIASGTLPVGNGGTGATTLTGVVKGSGSSALTAGNVDLTSEVSGTLPVASGGTGATTLTANAVVIGNDTGALQTVAPGTSGNALVSNGTSWISQAISSASVQTFSSSGTWTKPSGANFVLVEVWGAGGGGGRPQAGAANGPGGGGGGGAYNYRLFSDSELSSTVAVTIGAGGAGGTSNGGSGSIGGDTSFGGLIIGYAGAGGNGFQTGTNVNNGGPGGGVQSAGTGTSYIAGAPRNFNGTVANYDIGPSNFGGGIGGDTYTLGTTTTTVYNGRSSGFGGGGGGAANGSALTGLIGNGGASSYGGGGAGAGGANTSGGSSFNRSAGVGGGPIPSSTDGVGSGIRGGAPIQPGVTTPVAGLFRHGGCGGLPAASLSTYSNGGYFMATNGTQTAVLGVQSAAGESTQFIFVSSDGLGTYTTYPTGRVGGNSCGIVYDGSKYVMFSPTTSTGYAANGVSLFSTTNFTTFTDYTVPSTMKSLMERYNQ